MGDETKKYFKDPLDPQIGTVHYGIAALILISLRLLSLFPKVVDDDEAMFAVSGYSMRNPSDLYHAVVDNKPPGLPWLYWAINHFVDAAHLAQYARFFQIALLMGASALLSRMSRRREVALLFLLAVGALGPKIFAVTNEGMMIPFLVLSFALVWQRASTAWRYAGAGAAVAYATLIKQTGVLFVLPLLLTADSVLGAILFVGTFALVILGAALSLGFADLWHWAVVYPSSILSEVRHKLFAEWRDALMNTGLFILALFPLLLSALPRRRGEDCRTQRMTYGWLACAIATIVASRALFLHYFLLVIPPLCLLSEGSQLRSFLSFKWKRRWIWAAYGISALAAAIPMIGVFWGNDLNYYQALDGRIRALSRPSDRLFIWGGSSVPLAISGLKSVRGFPNARFAAGPYSNEKYARIFLTAFTEKLPELVIDLHERGDNQFDIPISSFSSIGRILRRDYVSWSDPSLPWVTFFKLRGPSRIPPPGFCRTRDRLSDQQPNRHYPSPSLDWIRSNHLLRVELARKWSISACGAETAGFSSPFALNAPFWWASLAVVEMQATWEH
jgi:hypothetical protein